MSPQPRQAFLVSHTHWDREWYLTFNRFRVNLVDTVDRVLEALESDPDFKHFVLDGQTAVVEDYLAAVPENRNRVQALIASGSLAIGPWYILPDEFLVSGEATARNLLHGRKTGRTLGRVQAVGYMPDSFGHLAQIPQILRLAGIDSFVFTRGLGDEADRLGWLFRWQAPDGSEVLAVNQCDGYCNAGGLGWAELWEAHTLRRVDPQLAVAKVSDLLEKMATRPGSEPALLNNGCDHFPPQKNLKEVLQALGEALPATEFIPGSFADFLKAARAVLPDDQRPLFHGEMLGGRDHPILSGVWSARMPLKQQNEAAQNLLCRVVEPLCALETFLLGGTWPAGLLDLTWKELLRNHPHDSICGCSTDSVHLDMETRFAAVRQTGEQIVARLMDRLSPMFGADAADDSRPVITVANPLPYRRDEVVERLVVLPPGSLDVENLHLVDESGRSVPFRILEKRYLERFWGIDYRGEIFCEDQLALLDTYLHRFGDRIIGSERDKGTHDCFLLLQFPARDLPAVGCSHYMLVDQAPAGPAKRIPDPARARLETDQAVLENNLVRVRLSGDGTFDLTDLNSGRRYPGLNLLEDTEDTGDEYDYCPAARGLTIFAAGSEGKVKITDRSDLLVGAEAVFRLGLPRGLERNRQSRQQRTTSCDVTVRLTLRAGSRRVDVETQFHNRAFDHRLRAWFPTGIDTREVFSDGNFLINRRPLERKSSDNWTQPAPRTWPQQDWSALVDQAGGLAVFNRGLPEFETWGDPDQGAVFALTLLRCVDWLSRDDLATRNNLNAGPTLHTPDAQCLGRQVFRYAVAPFGGDPLAAGLVEESERYRTPPVTHQGVTRGRVTGEKSLVTKTDPRVAITAIKRAERGQLLCLRLVNLSPNTVNEVLEFGLPVLDAEKAGLLETALDLDREPVFVSHGGIRLKVPLHPHEIATVIIELETPANLENADDLSS